ncbi:MAG: DinB family protein [bacterium]
MDNTWKGIIWQQFGAAIDMLENAVDACPDNLWGDRSQKPEFWYTVFHTLFYLDLYLSESDKGFSPPPPFNLDEMDPAGILPDRVYTKEELLAYLNHGRDKCRRTINALTDDQLSMRCGFEWLDLSVIEMHLYNMRHVQHHAAPPGGYADRSCIAAGMYRPAASGFNDCLDFYL